MIVNRQSRVSISLKDLETFLARALRRLHLPKDSLAICLVTNSEIARWNRAYRGKSQPTDVLSFPVDACSEGQNGGATRLRSRKKTDFWRAAQNDSAKYFGDIAIAPAVAKRNARRYGRSFDDEMRILVLHGILHLMGYNHEVDDGQMERRERQLRRDLRLA